MKTTRGFTLVELLVAITILGVLLSVSLGSIRIGSRSLVAGIDRADVTEDRRSTAEFLRRQLAELGAVTWEIGEEERIAFSGDSYSANFVVPAPDAVRDFGLLVGRLSVVDVGDGIEVWYGVTPYDPGIPTSQVVEDPAWTTRLAGGLEKATISYFGAQGERDEPTWHGAWRDDALRYPSAVRLEILPSGEETHETTWLFRIPAGREL